MQIRWKIVVLIAALALGLTALMSRKTATAAAPQAAAPAVKAPPAAKSVKEVPSSGISIPDTTLAINSDKPMSERVVHYEIDAKYDADKHIVDATEVLTYHNLTGQALDHFPFHLYQNAFQPKATFVRDSKLMGSRDTSYAKWEDKYYGSEDIKSLEVVGQGDLTSQLQYIAPDDGNKDDKTVVDLQAGQAHRAGRVCPVQDRVSNQVSRDAGAFRMEARLRARRPVVSEGGRVLAWSLELPPVSQHDRVLRRLRRVRRETDSTAI